MAWYPALIKSNELEIVTWADGTDEQIAAMLAAHYAGEIDVTEYWSVGEKRAIPISAMTATGVSESHHADTYNYVIIGLNHDDLVTPINGINKAAITVQQDRMFFTDTTITENTAYDTLHEYGYINSSNVNNTGWNTCARRTWCNGTYFNALPQYIQDNIKQVYKSTAHSGSTSSPTWVANTDKCFLLSEWEIFGTASRSAESGINTTHYINGTSGTSITMPAGGTKYSYFDSSTNRYKLPKYTGYQSGRWWERSPSSSNFAVFCLVNSGGSAANNAASNINGLAPAFCL